MSDNSSSVWMDVLIFLLLVGIVVLCSFNAATYYRIHNENITNIDSISPSAAVALAWINIIIAVFTGIVCIYYLYKIIRNRDKRIAETADVKRYIADRSNKFGGYMKSGYNYATTPSRWRKKNMDTESMDIDAVPLSGDMGMSTIGMNMNTMKNSPRVQPRLSPSELGNQVLNQCMSGELSGDICERILNIQ